MKKSDFYFDLPEELIAQTPIADRTASKLMVVSKQTGEIEHRSFYEITDFLKPGDLLVLNNSRVIPARLLGQKVPTGSAVEFMLLKPTNEKDVWEVMTRPGKKTKAGTHFSFGGGKITAEIIESLENGNRLAKFCYSGNFYEVLDEVGQMPLPHYITHKLDDKERYQTTYAKHNGSVAAPTAGLHFTPELLEKIRGKGVQTAFVTLHVGLGTFRPVKTEEITDHHMHSEHYTLSAEVAELLNLAKKEGRRIIAVGTTSCRTLESAVGEDGLFKQTESDTSIFIYPGYKFKAVDALVTNFHLPESTLIMLVSALLGYDNTMQAYKTATENKYRFFSFGDSMFIG